GTFLRLIALGDIPHHPQHLHRMVLVTGKHPAPYPNPMDAPVRPYNATFQIPIGARIEGRLDITTHPRIILRVYVVQKCPIIPRIHPVWIAKYFVVPPTAEGSLCGTIKLPRT